LGQRFHQFHTLNHMGHADFFLVQHEMGLAALGYDGARRWDYTGHAVVDSVQVENESVLIRYLAAPREVTLRLADGAMTP
jgi:hypothetical protein